MNRIRARYEAVPQRPLAVPNRMTAERGGLYR
jgi:hypothetical protein